MSMLIRFQCNPEISFFLFFKQKTAYEMRISDWCSDVCSSDLVLTVTSANVNGLRAAAKKGFVEWLAATSADVLCLQEVRAEPQQQIGRESCRERVSKYV